MQLDFSPLFLLCRLGAYLKRCARFFFVIDCHQIIIIGVDDGYQIHVFEIKLHLKCVSATIKKLYKKNPCM